MREDARCRKLGAVPLSETYMECRRQSLLARDTVYAARLQAEHDQIAAKAAKRAAKAAERAARRAARDAQRAAQQR